MTYFRKNRKTKQAIYLLHHNPSNKRKDSVYILACPRHATDSKEYKHRSDALRDMAHPWEWCEKCKNEVEVAA